MQFTFKKILVIVLLAFITLTVSLILLLLLNKDKIIKASINEINKFITTKIEVSDDIDVSIFEKFPQASIKFQNVNIYESSNNGIYKMAHAGNLYLAFDIWNIVKSNYIINDLYFEDGYLNIKIDQNGKKNYQIIKDDSSTTTNSALDLKNIVLKNVILSYQNKPGKQFHHLLIQNGSAQLELSKEICFVNFECASVIKSFNINGDNYFSNKNIKIKSKLEYHTNDELLKNLIVLY